MPAESAGSLNRILHGTAAALQNARKKKGKKRYAGKGYQNKLEAAVEAAASQAG
jgi:hypothetical protein